MSEVIRACSRLIDAAYLDEVPTEIEREEYKDIAVAARIEHDRMTKRLAALEEQVGRGSNKAQPVSSNVAGSEPPAPAPSSAVCECGHPIRQHTWAQLPGQRGCFVPGCSCANFRPAPESEKAQGIGLRDLRKLEKCGIRVSGDHWCRLPAHHAGPHEEPRAECCLAERRALLGRLTEAVKKVRPDMRDGFRVQEDILAILAAEMEGK